MLKKTTQEIKEQLERRKNAVRPFNERIRKLRDESLHSVVRVSPERAKLITDFYSNDEARRESIVMKRALAFRYLLEHCAIPEESGQLIVGIRGTGPNEVPTYPEICVHTSLDLELLNSRENMPYAVDMKTQALYKDTIIPHWKGRSLREKLLPNYPWSGRKRMKLGYSRSSWNRERQDTRLGARVSSGWDC